MLSSLVKRLPLAKSLFPRPERLFTSPFAFKTLHIRQMSKRKLSAIATDEPLDSSLNDGAKTEGKAKAKRAPKQAAVSAPSGTVYSSSMRPDRWEGPAFRVVSWNVASLRAFLVKFPKALSALADAEGVDVICLQETKLQEGGVAEVEAKLGLPGWHCYWSCSTVKKGYSGTALLCRKKPKKVTYGLGAEEHDGEGRLITAEFDDLFLVNTYVPNAGQGLKRLEYRVGSWDGAMAAHLASLSERKPVVLTGDLNCAYQEIDIHDPKRNLKSAGFTQEERDSFGAKLIEKGLVDAFRRQHPDVVAYTYWNYIRNTRASNKGWRLDYFLVSDGLIEKVHECYHLPDLMGSDHCPIGLVIKQE